jgi:hypothetical protein
VSAMIVVQPNPLVFNAPIEAIRYAAAGLPHFAPVSWTGGGPAPPVRRPRSLLAASSHSPQQQWLAIHVRVQVWAADVGISREARDALALVAADALRVGGATYGVLVQTKAAVDAARAFRPARGASSASPRRPPRPLGMRLGI